MGNKNLSQLSERKHSPYLITFYDSLYVRKIIVSSCVKIFFFLVFLEEIPVSSFGCYGQGTNVRNLKTKASFVCLVLRLFVFRKKEFVKKAREYQRTCIKQPH